MAFTLRWELLKTVEQRSTTPLMPVLQDPSGCGAESRLQPEAGAEVSRQGWEAGDQ